MMKAYMSANRGTLQLRPFELSADIAEREARMILAASEEQSCQSDYYTLPCLLWPDGLPRARRGGELSERVLVNMAASKRTFALLERGEEIKALTEALTLFVRE